MMTNRLRSLKIFMMPYNKNPYLENLQRALEKRGHQIYFFNYTKIFDLFKIVYKNGKPDIVHYHWLHQYWIRKSKFKMIIRFIIFLMQIVLLKIFSVKFYWTVHNLYPHKYENKNIEKIIRKIIIFVFNGVIVHSKNNRDCLLTEFKVKNMKKIFVIPHGHFIDNYQNIISTKAAKNVLNIDNDSFVFLFFGRVEEYKGVIHLINTFKKLNGKYNKLKLVIAGPIRSDYLKKQILNLSYKDESILTYLFRIDDEKIQNFMNSADIITIPYKDIFTSGSGILAMSFSKPIIIPKLDGITELLDERGAFFYEHSIIESLYRQMNNSIIAKNKLKSMGNYNYQNISKVDWGKISELTESLYEV